MPTETWNNPEIQPILLKPKTKRVFLFNGYLGGKHGEDSGYKRTIESLWLISLLLLLNFLLISELFLQKKSNWKIPIYFFISKGILYFPDFLCIWFSIGNQGFAMEIIPPILISACYAMICLVGILQKAELLACNFFIIGILCFWILYRNLYKKLINHVNFC